MRALIFEGRIVQVAAMDFPVHPSMQWADAPADATPETHIFDGGAVKPRPPKTAEELADEADRAARAELARIDLASIRSIREYIAAKPDAPAILKQHEQAAQAERAKVQPKP